MDIAKLSSILLGSLLYFSSADAINIDPSKYTATLKFRDGICYGGILSKRTIVSIAGCFVNPKGEVINYTSVTAVVGSVEVPVEKVLLPKDRILSYYAIVFLQKNVNLKKNGLTHLALPTSKRYPWGLVSNANYYNEPGNYTIVESKNCPSFIDNKSNLCVQLPNPGDRCLDKPGTPMVYQGPNRLEVIGIYYACYMESAHEVFARITIGSQSVMYHFYNSTHEDQARRRANQIPPKDFIEFSNSLNSTEEKLV